MKDFYFYSSGSRTNGDAKVVDRKKRVGNNDGLFSKAKKIRENPQELEGEVITEKKLELMTSLQPPPSSSVIRKISQKLHEAYHRKSDACAVCGQICEENVWLIPEDLPKAFYWLLRSPEGEDSLHEEIVKQYDASEKFPDDPRFKRLLLNVDGIKSLKENYEGNDGEKETTKLCVCTQFGCLGSLKRGNIPKFAIAQGNYFGRLPTHLRNMTHASLSLIRPVQSFGYLISYKEERGNEAALKLSGHMYSTRLETGMIRNKLPLKPEDVPIRVVVTSPGCTKQNMIAKGKLALMKKDYIVEKKKIRETLEFFKKLHNPVMSEIEIDYNELNALPDGDVSDSIFMIDDSEIVSKKGICNHEHEIWNRTKTIRIFILYSYAQAASHEQYFTEWRINDKRSR